MPRISARRAVLKEIGQCIQPSLVLLGLLDLDSDEECIPLGFEPRGRSGSPRGGGFHDNFVLGDTQISDPFLANVDSETEGEQSSDDDMVISDQDGGIIANILEPPRQDHPPSVDDSDSETDGESIFTLLAVLHQGITERRYMTPRFKIERPLEGGYSKVDLLCDHDFRVITRLSQATFKLVLDLIKSNPIFHNYSSCEQAPVHWQLACALDRLGNDGNGASAARSKTIFGSGHGTIFLYYYRVLHALNRLRTQYIEWPRPERRREILAAMEKKGFPGAVGFVDGTTFPLHGKPGFCGHKYLDRKKRYSIGAQVVCDHQHRIIHFMTGMPESVHDSRYFSQSPIMQDPSDCFCPGQYLLADSAYKALEQVVPSYKDNQRDDARDDTEEERIDTFNEHLSRARVVNEHTIGILKARWSSLRGLRINLQKQEDIVKVLRHTVACVVLHNVALQATDPWEEDIDPNDLIPPPAGGQHSAPRNLLRTAGQRKRYEVRMGWEDWFRTQGESTDD